MAAHVILIATSGALEGQQFTFTSKTQCIVGRSLSCAVHVSASAYAVSRYHCPLDIDALAVTMQDLGSLNGTYVNGELIGRRAKRLGVEEACLAAQPKYVLEDGDELGIGGIAFSVQMVQDPVPAGDAMRVVQQVIRQ
jgi:pSer/pThr/pTyr-binding forkhead associated (FHA) protein